MLSRSQTKSLNRNDRECEENEDYNWGDCLDEMFYLGRDCQDPWHVNPKVPLRACTNITEILRDYRRGPLWNTVDWDGQFWDRPYMAERELANTIRNGKRCKTPCLQTNFDVKMRSAFSKERLGMINMYIITIIIFSDKVQKFEYGSSQDWIYGLKLLYLDLNHIETEEYKVCDFSCLLSSAGGYLGLFFGISIFDVICSFEKILSKIHDVMSYLYKN